MQFCKFFQTIMFIKHKNMGLKLIFLVYILNFLIFICYVIITLVNTLSI